ncbi:deoxynucleoside kinase [Nitrosomonas sp.]|uniref:deoxynucleoside kinase n=1 Tax=Nitrosomonas sp. TaxID=42353 RepID=UPI00261F5E84|nr:deoxynucleoside kinase [Nitrosomonas sp.]MCW5601526.1 deoxynucleoside kinase [Nitrosomonas sp.]
MILKKYPYIAIEGPIGAGKTSLAQNMANYLECALLLERPEENPFLEKFYSNRARYALPTQLFFLLQRIDQFQPITHANIHARPMISDFLLEKDQLFARFTLSEPEYALYQKIYQQMKPQAPGPDLVIYLQASPEKLYERIKRRGSTYEKNITEEYLYRLSNCYTQFFHQYEKAPVIIVNSENLNFANNTADFNLLLQRINQMRSAREYFNCGLKEYL